jgi:16S rRNA (guanine527-N7)-methyltransferase
MVTNELRTRIAGRAQLAGVVMTDALHEGLACYYEVLAKWNAKVNLTAFRLTPAGEDEAIDRLLIEPVVAARHVPSHAVDLLDAGSGGGSPALPLRLALPHLSLRMVESRTKKALFLREAIRVLGLSRAWVEAARFEDLVNQPALRESVDVVSVRAVRVDPRDLMTLQEFLKPGGSLLVFKGSGADDVATSTQPPLQWKATHTLLEPINSRLVVLEKALVTVRQ